ncbi:MAG TPA: ATP-binding protein [Sphingomonas sp.]|nr:ATP-binding protein [Sphingomonas sp.]
MEPRFHLRRWAGRLAATPRLSIAIAIGLLVASLLLALHNEHIARAEKVGAVTVQTRILAGSVAAPLAFDDVSTMQEYIGAMKVNPEVEAVGAYGMDGRLRAGFVHDGGPLPSAITISPPAFAGGDLIVTAPVAQNGTLLGSVYLRAALEPWTRRVLRYVGIAIILVMASLLIVVLGASYASIAEAHRRLREETEGRRQAEDALRQAQKMEAMGQLTGGVAHDFNNLLMVASSGVELLDRTKDPARRERLKTGIREALDRGAKLTQQLLTFARRSPLKPEPIDLARHIRGLHDLLERSLREDIAVDLALPEGLWPVEVDPSQFDVALLNIAVNARDAMPDGGAIRIAAANRPGDEEGGADMVGLAVSDTGVGLAPELIEKVFEPFFTTKGVGKGTGLGLSQVYGFARSSGGSVTIESEAGEGATVTLLLPRSLAEPPRTAVPEPVCGAGKTPRRCRVLMAEDDDHVADFVGEMLHELGYEYLRAASAAEALAAIERGERFDLLLSDMVMPGDMGGLDLARELRRRRPDMPILLMTGYSTAAAAAGEEGIRLLAKPYTLESLAAALAEALGAG